MTARRPLSRTLRLAVLARDHGLCQECMRPVGCVFEVDHVVAHYLTADDSMGNLRLLHRTPCHRRKSRTDVRVITKTKRQRARHLGQVKRRKRLLKSRGFCKTLRRRMNGTVERRT